MAHQATRRGLLGGLPSITLVLICVTLIGLGGYLYFVKKLPTTALFCCGLGLSFLPIPAIGLFGALVCIAAGAWNFYLYGIGLQGGIYFVIGLLALGDHVQVLNQQRELRAAGDGRDGAPPT